MIWGRGDKNALRISLSHVLETNGCPIRLHQPSVCRTPSPCENNLAKLAVNALVLASWETCRSEFTQVTIVRRILPMLCMVLFGMSVHGWSQTELSPLFPTLESPTLESPTFEYRPNARFGSPQHRLSLRPSIATTRSRKNRPSFRHTLSTLPTDSVDRPAPRSLEPCRETGVEDRPIADSAVTTPHALFHEIDNQTVRNAFGTMSSAEVNPVQTIPSFVAPTTSAHRIVRYEVPLADEEMNRAFLSRGIEGRLIEVTDKSDRENQSVSDRLRTFLSPKASWQNSKKVRVVRYEVPASDILFHSQLTELDGQILEPGMLRLPEVRFFQPKARVFMDLKRSNDGEFDLFNDGAILASLDVIELYFPMPLISERFAEVFGKSGPRPSLGWRVGGTIGLGISTALHNGSSDNGSAPVSTLSTGVRYEFPLGRPSRELLDTGDTRLDQRTRVGMEFGFQGGVSTRESLRDSTDIGLYFGVLVNTPWGG